MALVELFKNLPRILQEAARNRLGLLALIIVAAAIVTVILFLTAPTEAKLVAFCLLLLAEILLVARLTREPLDSSATGTPAPGAEQATTAQAAAVCWQRQDRELKFLLIKSSGGRWIFPKGHIERGETPWTTALREAHEEAGVQGEIEQQELVTFRHHKRDLKRRGRELKVKAFLLHVTAVQEPQERGRAPKWFTYEEARTAVSRDRAYEYAEEMRKVLQLAKERLSDNQALPSIRSDEPSHP